MIKHYWQYGVINNLKESQNIFFNMEDEQGRSYQLIREPVGMGGQGKVFMSEEGKYAVKVLDSKSSIIRKRLEVKLRRVKRLPISDLPIAKPLSMLPRPAVGYVMEFFSGMTSLKKLLHVPKGENVVSFYIETGGLSRRLEILAKFARVFAQLHARSIAYCDLSFNNLFISADKAFQEIRLIDADNLFISSASTPEIVYTPGYGAPELVNKSGTPSTFSDTFSFALLAYELITLNHAFKGDEVRNGPPEMEDQAFAGKLPWVGNLNNTSNKCTVGLPQEYVASPKMLKAFDATFDNGLAKPYERTTLNQWVAILDLAADNLLICPSCKGSYYRNRSDCPWCGEKAPEFIRGVVYHFDPMSYKKHVEQNKGSDPQNAIRLLQVMKPIGSITFQESTIRSIERRTAFQDCGLAANIDVVNIKTKRGGLIIQPCKGETVWLSNEDFQVFHRHISLEGKPFHAGAGQILHFGDRSKPHCIVQFEQVRVTS